MGAVQTLVICVAGAAWTHAASAAWRLATLKFTQAAAAESAADFALPLASDPEEMRGLACRPHTHQLATIRTHPFPIRSTARLSGPICADCAQIVIHSGILQPVSPAPRKEGRPYDRNHTGDPILESLAVSLTLPVSWPVSAIVATPESKAALCGRPVALPGSLSTALIPVAVTGKSTVEVPPAAAPESQEETPAGVPRTHPIPACVRRKHPIASDPGVPSTNGTPISVHPVIPRARHWRALIGVAWHRRRRRSIDTLVAAVVGRVPAVSAVARIRGRLPVVILAIAILPVVARGALIGRVLLRILLRVLLPKHG